MKNYLNKPESIEEGFLSIEKRIRAIEQAVGYEKISELSHSIADFLYHMQDDESSINCIVTEKRQQANIAICILNASVEMQSTYHLLTTGNLPGVYKQCRLLHEFVAVIIFISVPRKLLLNSLSSKKHGLISILGQNTDVDFWDLYTPKFQTVGKNVQRKDPIVKGNLLLSPYMDFIKNVLKIEKSEITWLETQIKHVQHPLSHGSIEFLPFHFGTAAKDGKGGINYSSNKDDWYRDAMAYLIWTVVFLTKVLNLTTDYLQINTET